MFLTEYARSEEASMDDADTRTARKITWVMRNRTSHKLAKQAGQKMFFRRAGYNTSLPKAKSSAHISKQS